MHRILFYNLLYREINLKVQEAAFILVGYTQTHLERVRLLIIEAAILLSAETTSPAYIFFHQACCCHCVEADKSD